MIYRIQVSLFQIESLRQKSNHSWEAVNFPNHQKFSMRLRHTLTKTLFLNKFFRLIRGQTNHFIKGNDRLI